MLHKMYVGLSFGIALALASGQALAGPGIEYPGNRPWAHASEQYNLPPSHSASKDIRFKYKFDVLWDWAHRYPSGFFPPPPAVTVGIAQPVSGDTNFTYTFDVPWDWAHRYPPGFLAGTPEPPPPPPVV